MLLCAVEVVPLHSGHAGHKLLCECARRTNGRMESDHSSWQRTSQLKAARTLATKSTSFVLLLGFVAIVQAVQSGAEDWLQFAADAGLVAQAIKSIEGYRAWEDAVRDGAALHGKPIAMARMDAQQQLVEELRLGWLARWWARIFGKRK